MSGSRVYLDHAATTPILPEVIEVVGDVMAALGNPSSPHAAGREARRILEESRESVATSLGALPRDVIFTASGTEADNLAVKGMFWARKKADQRRVRIITSAIEHPAVRDSVDWLATYQGAKTERIGVDNTGRLDTDALRASIAEDPASVALVSVMWANNEVGTLQPIGEIAAAAHEYGIPVHSDAVQAVGHVACDFSQSGLDAMTVSGHKIGGPVGVGVLVARPECELVPVLHGGGQEREVRSGTLDAAGAAGLARALHTAVDQFPASAERLAKLRDALVEGVTAKVPGAIRHGDSARSLPNIAHFSFPGCDGDSLLLLLDVEGIACSTGSACSSGVTGASHVLLAMGIEPYVARGSLRFSLGHTSTEADVASLVSVVGQVVEKARAAGTVNQAQEEV